MCVSRAQAGVCFPYETDEIAFPTGLAFFPEFRLEGALTSRPWRKPSGSVHTHLTLVIQEEEGTSFHFSEFLHYPIRCALPAHDGDLGLFIFAHLNIYFSAQGEAEKKNVRGLDSTPAPRLLPTPLTFTRQPRWHPRNHGIHSGERGVWAAFARSLAEVHRAAVWLRRSCLHFSSQHIVLIQFLFLMTRNTLL